MERIKFVSWEWFSCKKKGNITFLFSIWHCNPVHLKEDPSSKGNPLYLYNNLPVKIISPDSLTFLLIDASTRTNKES